MNDWEKKVARDLLLPGLAAIEATWNPICLDMQYSPDGNTLNVLFWPNPQSCKADETPMCFPLVTRAEWEKCPESRLFWHRMLRASADYHSWIS